MRQRLSADGGRAGLGERLAMTGRDPQYYKYYTTPPPKTIVFLQKWRKMCQTLHGGIECHREREQRKEEGGISGLCNVRHQSPTTPRQTAPTSQRWSTPWPPSARHAAGGEPPHQRPDAVHLRWVLPGEADGRAGLRAGVGPEEDVRRHAWHLPAAPLAARQRLLLGEAAVLRGIEAAGTIHPSMLHTAEHPTRLGGGQ